MQHQATLYLIPTPLGEGANYSLPAHTIQVLHELDTFIVERSKTVRQFIKSTQHPVAQKDLTIFELDKYEPTKGIEDFLAPAEEGVSIGLLSEAGCPGVADPGSEVVGLAHRKGIEVVALTGPSSILLALMGSGMNGQEFCFRGYLSPKKPELAKDLRQLEQLSIKFNQTQIFIETPYRNQALIEQALNVLAPKTRFCIAADLTLPTQYLKTKSIQAWRKNPPPKLHKRPAIFLIYGS